MYNTCIYGSLVTLTPPHKKSVIAFPRKSNTTSRLSSCRSHMLFAFKCARTESQKPLKYLEYLFLLGCPPIFLGKKCLRNIKFTFWFVS